MPGLKTFAVAMTVLLIAHITIPYIVSMGAWEPVFWVATSLTALVATMSYFRGEMEVVADG